MTKKENFVKFVDEMILNSTEDLMNEYCANADINFEDAMSYFNAFKETKEKEKSEMTENGKNILRYLQSAHNEGAQDYLRAKDIAEGLEISSRSVSGSIRKLVTDGYVEKIGDSPASYSLTQKGIEFSL